MFIYGRLLDFIHTTLLQLKNPKTKVEIIYDRSFNESFSMVQEIN